MNKKGQTLGLAVMTGIFVFIIGLMVVNFVMDEVTQFRVNMNCANADSISDGTKLVCLVADTTVIYWIIIVFSILITAITARIAI
jgi:hypothetical protein